MPMPTLPRFEDLADELGVDWPRPEISHAAFLERLDHPTWLEDLAVSLEQLRGEQARNRNNPPPVAGPVPVTTKCPCGHAIRSHGIKGCRSIGTCGCSRTQKLARNAIANQGEKS